MAADMSDSMQPDRQPEVSPTGILLIPTRVLLLLAAAAWFVAGAAVVSVAVKCSTSAWSLWMPPASLAVFTAFLAMFLNISKRNVTRILAYREPLSFILSFFDANSYMIMAVMMFLGAAIRVSTFAPDAWIAFFYSGLGAALVLSGFYPLVNYLSTWSGAHFDID